MAVALRVLDAHPDLGKAWDYRDRLRPVAQPITTTRPITPPEARQLTRAQRLYLVRTLHGLRLADVDIAIVIGREVRAVHRMRNELGLPSAFPGGTRSNAEINRVNHIIQKHIDQIKKRKAA